MRTKYFFMVTAAVELGAGLALAIRPSMATSLLLGATRLTPEAMTIGRIAGAALSSLGIACWLAREDERGRAATGLVAAMFAYNTGAIAILSYTGIVSERVGVIVWPGVVLHTTLAAWCIACLRRSLRGG